MMKNIPDTINGNEMMVNKAKNKVLGVYFSK